jgi:Asp-tRNA(Asn)/Glu-tRNA(Gln) amidotransferase C subunit
MPDVKRVPTDAEIVSILAKHARLDLTPTRAAELAPALDGILELLDALDDVKLGETAPAFAYRAKWEGTR